MPGPCGEWDVSIFDPSSGPNWVLTGTAVHFPHDRKLEITRGLLVGMANRGVNGAVLLQHRLVPSRFVAFFLDRSTNPGNLVAFQGNQFDL